MEGDFVQQLRHEYLNAVRCGNGRQADKVIEKALGAKFTAGQIYLEIFQPTGYAIGELWQQNLISVAQEHLATAIIEREMGELHPYFRPKQLRHKRLVIGCVDGEHHRVGARMAADFFEEDGWTVHYLGATVPTSAFISFVREVGADLIGLGSQLIYRLPTVLEFMRALSRKGLESIPVMVGGHTFRYHNDLHRALGVQFTSANALEAVDLANSLFLK